MLSTNFTSNVWFGVLGRRRFIETATTKPTPPPTTPRVEHTNQENEEVKRLKEEKEKLICALADCENARKHEQHEAEERCDFGISNFAKDMIEVLDNFDRAMKITSSGRQTSDGDGIRMIRNDMVDRLARHGVRKMAVSSGTPFDPRFHHAMLEVAKTAVDGNTSASASSSSSSSLTPQPQAQQQVQQVAMVIKDGFMLKTRLLRPALFFKAKMIEELEALVVMIVTAVGIQVYSAYRSVIHSRQLRKQKQQEEEEHGQQHEEENEEELGGIVLNKRTALLFPLLASITLLLFHFFFNAMSFIAYLSILGGVVHSVAFILAPHLRSFFPAQPQLFKNTRLFGTDGIPAMYPIIYCITICLLLLWLSTGSMLLSNAFSCALVIMFISMVEVPSLKVATLLLSALVIYDIFWVFLSGFVFGGKQSVMVQVATTSTQNPIHVVASALSIRPSILTRLFTRSLQAPTKLVFFNRSMLGLGDIAIPGLVLSLLARFDDTYQRLTTFWPHKNSYFLIGCLGYVLGLVSAMIVANLTQSPQPALLFIVPFILIPTITVASSRGDLHSLWASPQQPQSILSSSSTVSTSSKSP